MRKGGLVVIIGGVSAAFGPTRRKALPLFLAGTLAGFGGGVLALAGCGGGASIAGLGPGDAARMRADLTQVARLAGAGNRQGALSALNAFAAQVAQQHSAGHLSASLYSAMETGIARARHRIELDVGAPAPTVTTTPVTPPARTTPGPKHAPPKPQKPPGGEHPGKGHGHGQGDQGDGG